jgi:glycosyltransferase involved in cell wall biosynthesis
MKINQLNSYYHGGASIAARRLHESFVKNGINSRFYYCQYTVSYRREVAVPDSSYACLFKNNSIIAKCYRALRSRISSGNIPFPWSNQPRGFEKFRSPKLYYKTPFSLMDRVPTVLHLHWISEFIDYPSFFFSIPKHLPIVWTIHDMSAFTGGCSYSWGCNRFKTICRNCPQLKHQKNYDYALECFNLKKEVLRDLNIHVVADSKWIEKEARSSALFSTVKSFQTIHYGLDDKVFHPQSRPLSRKLLGIPETKTVLAYGAADISNPRKGTVKLLRALSALKQDDNLLIISFGNGQPAAQKDEIQTKHFGYIASSEDLASVYSAADIFIMPSLYEAFGQTALEAMACGTPVVGFDTGGIADMIIPYQSGLLAQAESETDLADKIQWMIDHLKERKEMGRIARNLVENRFTLNHQIGRYMSLYNTITDSAEYS